jgi:alkanesulfonate monooxygenase SsuD/methylene tetrahydromethanopterin reductase-like flavin-dependent oxidoreductase (luciferase family)
MWPKPVQKPHPPIHVGGGYPGAARRAARYGNGWIPIAGRDDDLPNQIPAFKKLAKEAGRNPAEMEVSVFGVTGNADVVAKYRDAGVDRAVFGLPPVAREKMLPLLDQLASFPGGS